MPLGGHRRWTERGSGRALRAIMEPGAKIHLSQFSKLNSNIFLKDITDEFEYYIFK